MHVFQLQFFHVRPPPSSAIGRTPWESRRAGSACGTVESDHACSSCIIAIRRTSVPTTYTTKQTSYGLWMSGGGSHQRADCAPDCADALCGQPEAVPRPLLRAAHREHVPRLAPLGGFHPPARPAAQGRQEGLSAAALSRCPRVDAAAYVTTSLRCRPKPLPVRTRLAARTPARAAARHCRCCCVCWPRGSTMVGWHAGHAWPRLGGMPGAALRALCVLPCVLRWCARPHVVRLAPTVFDRPRGRPSHPRCGLRTATLSHHELCGGLRFARFSGFLTMRADDQ